MTQNLTPPGQALGLALAERRQAPAGSQRVWLHQELEQRGADRRRQACADFETEARERGYCVECWGRSTDWGMWPGQARRRRHRRPENCPSIRRRRT